MKKKAIISVLILLVLYINIFGYLFSITILYILVFKKSSIAVLRQLIYWKTDDLKRTFINYRHRLMSVFKYLIIFVFTFNIIFFFFGKRISFTELRITYLIPFCKVDISTKEFYYEKGMKDLLIITNNLGKIREYKTEGYFNYDLISSVDPLYSHIGFYNFDLIPDIIIHIDGPIATRDLYISGLTGNIYRRNYLINRFYK